MSDPWKQFRPSPLARLRVALAHAGVLVLGAVIVGAFAAWATRLNAVDQEGETPQAEIVALVAARDRALEETRGELEVTKLQLERASEVIRYSSTYRIPADLSAAIYDIALAEGIHPALGFQLVRVESRFRSTAVSSAGAIGYTQIRLPTARAYEPDITVEQLADRDTNLRLGFRFLRDLLRRFNSDLDLALLAYNRGPTLVDSIRASGGDPRNGYAEAVKRGLSPAARTGKASGT